MSEPFVGEVRMFAGNFAPRGWAFCDGQLLAVSQNDALFSLLGTIYGGDGRTTFGLPDLRGRVPIHAGSGPGLSPRRLGAKAGAENVTLTVNQLPSHTHAMQASNQLANNLDPVGRALAPTAFGDVYTPDLAPENMNSQSITNVGGSRSHTNLQPFLCIHFIIALFGIYPSRN
ncbi:MAG: tail fiber protein [Acidobacteriota bacterium]